MNCREYFYHSYLDKCLVRYSDPIHLKQRGSGSGSSRDVGAVFERHASWWLIMQHFRSPILPPVSAMLVGQQPSAKFCIFFALQKTHIFRKYVWNRVYCDLLFEITSEIDFKTVKELIHVQEGGRVWEQEKRCSINASHICFEIQRKKFEKLEVPNFSRSSI